MPFATTTEAGVPIQGPSATLIYDDWYPALRTDTLRGKKLATAMLLGIPLVLGSPQGHDLVAAFLETTGVEGEILVVSDGSTDDTVAVARAHTKMGDLANLGRNKVRIDDLITAILQGTQP